MFKAGDLPDAERAFLVSAVVTSCGATLAEAASRVDAEVTATQKARTDAEKALADAKAAADKLATDSEAAAIKAAEMARVSAILSAFLLAASAMVAAAAACVGAVRGGHHRDESRIFGGFAYRGQYCSYSSAALHSHAVLQDEGSHNVAKVEVMTASIV